LAEALVEAGAEVRGLVYYNSFGSKGWLDSSPLAREMELIAGDVRDGAQMQQLVKGVDIVFHLAALIAIPYSYRAAASYVQTNVEGTLISCRPRATMAAFAYSTLRPARSTARRPGTDRRGPSAATAIALQRQQDCGRCHGDELSPGA